MYARSTWRGLIVGGLFVFGSCQQTNIGPDVFRGQLFLTLTSAIELFYLNEKLWKSEEIISGPKKNWQYLLGYDSWSKEDFKTSRFCLFVLIPNSKRKKTGKLKLVETSINKNCLGTERAEAAWVLPHVRSLKTVMAGPSSKLIFEGYIKNSEHSRGQKIYWAFPLYNIAMDDMPSKILRPSHHSKRYAHSRERTYQRGPRVMGLKRFVQEQVVDGRILDQKDKLCHQINEHCEQVINYQCDECLGGWYEVRGNGCPGGGNKYCGINRCGEKNRPACNGGSILSVHQVKKECLSDSPIGICQEGLKVECVNGQLVCL